MRTSRSPFLFPLLILLTGFSAALPAQPRPPALSDLRTIAGLSDPQISPDGRSAVFLVRRTDYDNNRYRQELVWIDLAGRRQRTLVSERPGLAQPRWSPDGQQLAFIAGGPAGRQVYVLPLAGGEARPVTASPGGVQRYAWSPDGARIAYIAADPRPEPTGAARFNRSFEVGSNDYLVDEASLPSGIWVVDAGGGSARRLTPEGMTAATGLSVSSLAWSPDGRTLAFTRFPTPNAGDTDLGQVCLVDVESGQVRPATPLEGRQSSAAFTPDGRRLTFAYPRDGVPANLTEIYQVAPEGGTPASLTRPLDRDVADARWLAGGRLLVEAPDGTRTGLWLGGPEGRFQPLPLGDVVDVGGWSTTPDGAVLLVGTEPSRPAELYLKPSPAAEPARLTDFNGHIAALDHGKPETFRWESSDGLRPDGVLTYPPGFDPAKKYPLVLYIHGGPTAASSRGFNLFVQVMAAKGWIVFQPNYRGSNNLGNAFQSAIADDAAEGPGQDVMSGVEALKQKPFIDTARIAVSGWSYGGWMTAWLIGRYPGVWAAAMAGAAPVDYTDMYSLNDLNRMRRHAITGSPYRSAESLRAAYEQSPITHFPRIRTPTLIMSKTADARVTITGSYKLYGALRDNGVPVRFIAYPGPGHFPGDPVQATDVYERWTGWLEQYLNPVKP